MEREWERDPGVIDVTSYGGSRKECTSKMRSIQGSRGDPSQLTKAISNANEKLAGGSGLSLASSLHGRGVGLVGSLKEMKSAWLWKRRGCR